MSKVTVNTQGLRQKASTISSEAAAYQKEMQKMFEAVESLKSSCEGTDINAYVKDIVNCKPEMEALQQAVCQRADAGRYRGNPRQGGSILPVIIKNSNQLPA